MSEDSSSFEVRLLREQLDFARSQLDDKDKQIEHYKSLVKTLQDLLVQQTHMSAMLSGSGTTLPNATSTSNNNNNNNGNSVVSSLNTSTGSNNGNNNNSNNGTANGIARPPPGFEQSNNNKTRLGKTPFKSYSFHETLTEVPSPLPNSIIRSSLTASQQQQPPSALRTTPKKEEPSSKKSLYFQLGGNDSLDVDAPSSSSMNQTSSNQFLNDFLPVPVGAELQNQSRFSDSPASLLNGTLISNSSSLPLSSSTSVNGLSSNGSDTFRGLRNLDFDLAPNSHTPASLLERAISPTSLSLQQPSSNSLPPSTTTNMSQITANSNSATNALLLLGSLVDNSPSDLLLGGDKNGAVGSGVDRRLRKSVSHYTPNNSSIKSATIDDPRGLREGDRASRSSLTNSSGDSTSSTTTTTNSNRVLKKSQSLNSVSTATLLEESRLDLKFPELDQLVGHIYALSKYQQGCRFLQKKLEEKSPSTTEIIFGELYDHLVELMTDPFGNYLFTKLIEHCTSQQKDRAVQRILMELLSVAVDMYGTQSLQKIMPFLDRTQVFSIIATLKTNTITLVKHSKANYLIQYFLDHLSPEYTAWIYDAVVEHLEEVSRDRVGCVIVKKCVDHASPEQQHRLIGEIVNRVLNLVQDPFGNYVVQHILAKAPEQSDNLIRGLLGHLTDLCVQKFSSNVVEKCLQVSHGEMRRRMLIEIINSDVLPQLLNDRFANFVIQTALDVAEPEQHKDLVQRILPHLGKHYSPYSKHLQKKILKV